MVNIPTITSETRQKQGFTLQEFGDALGVSKQAVHQWETDEDSPPGAMLLISVAMKCKGWRRDWAWACIEAHPRYIAYACPDIDTDAARRDGVGGIPC